MEINQNTTDVKLIKLNMCPGDVQLRSMTYYYKKKSQALTKITQGKLL